MNFNTIPDDQTYLRPKKATTSNLKGRLVGAAVLSFVIACLATTGTTGASATIIQPTTSLASEPAPAANEKPAPPAPAADQKAKPTCGRDANSPCSAQDFIDILDQEGWTARQPQPVDPNKNECASNPWGIGSDIQQGFKKVHSNEYESVGDGPLDFPPGSCGSRVSWDPRVFGPHTWKTLHTFAVNYHSPPTEAAVDACTNFINALPYLIPCSHCAWDFGQCASASQRVRSRRWRSGRRGSVGDQRRRRDVLYAGSFK